MTQMTTCDLHNETISRLQKRIAELEREVASYKTLTMQLAKAEESACIEAFHADEDRKKAESALAECMKHADAMANAAFLYGHDAAAPGRDVSAIRWTKQNESIRNRYINKMRAMYE